MLKQAENPFQHAFNVTQQLYILVLYCAEMFLADFKMAAVFLAKLQRRENTALSKTNRLMYSLTPPLFLLDSPYKNPKSMYICCLNGYLAVDI
jgi:hypothetical protein